MGLFLCILLGLLLIGGLPFWSHMSEREWGYFPSAVCALLLLGVGALMYYEIIPWR
jgi:uncharacterized protein DUF3309